MENSTQLNYLAQRFDIYYNNAKRYEAQGQIALAKRNYFLSAEVLMEMAKISSPKLAEVKFERAKRIIELADNLNEYNVGQNNSSSHASAPGGAAKNKQKDSEDGAKKFAAAQIPNVHFSDIAGLDDVKEAIKVRMIYPLKHPEVYSAYGKKMGGGMLLYGPPGTGKTMIAKAIACEVGATFYAVKGSDIVSKWVGESEQNINALFDSARQNELSIIFIDEIDSLLGKRGVDTHNDKRVNEFLQQIDGFGSDSSKILLLGATNRPWDIDSAAMRSGRFSEKIYVPLPDRKARRFLFDKYLKGLPLASDVDIDELVTLTEGYSGADINEICDSAKIEPLKKSIISREEDEDAKLTEITFNDFRRAFTKVRSSVTKEELRKLDEFAKAFNLDISKKPETNNEQTTAPTTQPKPEVKKEEPKPQGNNLKVILQSNTIKLVPNQKTSLEFYIDGESESVYAKVDSHNYVCKRNIRNWIIDNLNVSEGEYTVEVTADGKKATFNIKVIKGIDETDYDL